MKVRFLQDYRGHLSDEVFYVAGAVEEMRMGAALIAAGRAERVEEEEPEETPLESLPVEALRELAKSEGVKNAGRMKRETLLERLGE